MTDDFTSITYAQYVARKTSRNEWAIGRAAWHEYKALLAGVNSETDVSDFAEEKAELS